MTDSPLITCLCLTRNRRAWLPRAIACFLAQTYENRELLIVSDGDDDTADLIPDDPRVRLHVVNTGNPPLLIGHKRNWGNSHAMGEWIAHWDDDDWSAPGRLADQARRLQENGKAVTGYHTLPYTDGENWWLYEGAPQYALGMSLCYRKSWWANHPFRAVQLGDDATFVNQAASARQLATADGSPFLAVSNHVGNTETRRMNKNPFRLMPPSYAGPAGFVPFARARNEAPPDA